MLEFQRGVTPVEIVLAVKRGEGACVRGFAGNGRDQLEVKTEIAGGVAALVNLDSDDVLAILKEREEKKRAEQAKKPKKKKVQREVS